MTWEGGEVHLLGLLLLQDHRARVARTGLLPGDQHADQHWDGLQYNPRAHTDAGGDWNCTATARLA